MGLTRLDSSVALFLALAGLKELKQLRDTVTSPYIVYLLTKVGPRESLSLPPDAQFLTEVTDLSLLKGIAPPDTSLIENLHSWQLSLPVSHPLVYLYKLANEYLTSQCSKQSRYECLLTLLKH